MDKTNDRSIKITHELDEVRRLRVRPLRRPRVLVHDRPNGVEITVRAPGATPDRAVVCVDDSLCALALPARDGGSWYASFLLPSDVDDDDASAGLNDDQLTLWIPRRRPNAAG